MLQRFLGTLAVGLGIGLTVCLHWPSLLAAQTARPVVSKSTRTEFQNQPRVALVVGIGSYPESSNLNPLTYSDDDATAVDGGDQPGGEHREQRADRREDEHRRDGQLDDVGDVAESADGAEHAGLYRR